MQQEDTINTIIEPEAVSFWPPQPGWYVVLALLLILIGLLLIRYLKNKKKNAYRRRALAQLETYASDPQPKDQIKKINLLLKSCALKAYPRAVVASLYGEQWIQFLNNTSSSVSYTSTQGKILEKSLYGPMSDDAFDNEAFKGLIKESKTWIKTHKANDKIPVK